MAGHRTYLIVRNVNFDFSLAFLGNGLDEKPRVSEVVLIIDCESFGVSGESNILRPRSSNRCDVKRESKRAKNIASKEKPYLRIGTPFALASLNAVYHTGSKEYRSRRISRIMLLYGSSKRKGSRRLVSICP